LELSFMPLLLLLVLTLACLPESWQPTMVWIGLPQNPLLSAVLTWLGVAIIVVAARRIAALTCSDLRENPQSRETIIHTYASRRLYHALGLASYYAGALFLLGWGWTVQRLCTPGSDARAEMLPGAELLILAPFLAGLLASWWCFYDADRVIHETANDRSPFPASSDRPFWSRRGYVSFHLRQNLALVLAPLLAWVAVKGLSRLFPDKEYGDIVVLAGMAMLAGVFVGFPWLLRLVLGLKPLPAGPLRDRLLAAARRLRFRCSNILLWNTNGGVANAMVAGIVPGIRYVLLTDRLVNELPAEEVEAVFGHEVGHVKHRHMLYYLGFLLVSLLAVGRLCEISVQVAKTYYPALESYQMNDDLAQLPMVGLAGAYIFVVFGFLSRRCERQADIYGCRAVSCVEPDCPGHDEGAALAPAGRGLCSTGIRTFIAALEKVAQLNHISRNRPGWLQSWQHSTIARRVEFLQRMLADPTVEPRFQRTVTIVKWALVIGLGVVLAILGSLAPWGA
jgi:Zn-dependent protease with chaperone function